MKSPSSWKWCMVLSLTFLPFAGGCLRAGSETNLPAGGAELQAAELTTSTDVDAAALEAAKTNAPAIDISEAEVKPVEADLALPSTVRTQGPAGDLLKLASSGVEDKVILAFITNSPSVFDLTADEIIYLKDLGISGDVVSASMHRDQVLKAAGASGSVQAPPPTIPQDAGITTNWIGAASQQQAGQQPDPSQVAPQATAPPLPEQGPQAQEAPVTVAPPQVEVTYSSFYSSLSPYGRWLEVDGYGRVWQPTVVVVNSSWSPYFDSGRWVYTDLGWYWHSDYSWGWAPFHYGRWFRHQRIGWCWAPDLVWGPSWVTWRYNDAYCGWAPLPPAACYRPGFGFTYYGSSVSLGFGFGLGYSHYSFVHWDRFHHHHRNSLHAMPIHERERAYHDTRPVTKIVTKNNHIINEGLSAQRVSRATRTEVKPVAVREVKSRNFSPASGRPERLDPAKRTLTVYKPETPKGEVGGIPMERVGKGSSPGSRTSRVAERGPTGASGVKPSGVESRFSGSGSTPAAPTASPRAEKDRNGSTAVARPPLDRSGGSRTAEARPGTRSAPAVPSVTKSPEIRTIQKPGEVSSKPAGTGAVTPATKPAVAPDTARNQDGERRPEPSVSRPTSVESRSQQRSIWASPRNAENRLAPERSATSGSPASAQPRSSVSVTPAPNSQPVHAATPSSRSSVPSIASPKNVESPGRIERRSVSPTPSISTPPTIRSTPSAVPSVSAPSAARQPSVWASPRSSSRPTPSPSPQLSSPPSSPARQYTSPSVAPRQSTPAPSISRPSAPVGSRSSAPAPSPRQYSAPTPSPRQYSAPPAASSRSYSPSPSISVSPRSYSPSPSVSASPRSYSPPPSVSASPRSYSPAPRSQESGRSSYSAPSAPRSSPAPSSSRGSSSGGRGGRSER